MLFPEAITSLFTRDAEVLAKTPPAMRWVFAVTPIIGIQLIGAAYFQAIGKAIPALLIAPLPCGIIRGQAIEKRYASRPMSFINAISS